jgi:hypothetical protein
MSIKSKDLPPHVQAMIDRQGATSAPRRSKYNAVPTDVDGIRFDSKREAAFYRELMTRQSAGDLKYFLRQIPFHLPGGVKYVCDFVVFENDGRVRFIDVKGVRTKTYVAKKKIVEALYPIVIEEVR